MRTSRRRQSYAVTSPSVNDSRVLFNAVITAEGGPVEIGGQCIIMEHALVRGRAGHPTRIGDNVLIGPHAYVNGAIIEENAFIATVPPCFRAPP